MPMISIIIVTYNNERDILECLASLPWQDACLNVICIDNRSTDQTCQRIRSLMWQHPDYPIRFISNRSNRGYAAAINQGLRLVRGEWICILGPDTVLSPNTLNVLRSKLESNPEIGIAAPQLIRPDQSIQPSCRRFPKIKDVLLELTGLPRVLPGRFPSKWKMDDFSFKIDAFVDQPEASCLFIRKEALHDVGPMDERFPIFFNDVDWCRRFHQVGWKIVFTPDSVLMHRQGTSVGASPARMIWKSHQGFYRYFRKYSRSFTESFLLHWVGFFIIWTACLRISVLHFGYSKAAMNPKN